MATTRLSSKGQVIIPKAVRKTHRWDPGTVFIVEDVRDGVLLKPAKRVPSTTIKDVIGSTGYRGPRRSIQEMDRAVMNEARRHRR